MALQDRTEPATPRRREEARSEGKVAKSIDVNSAIVLLASVLILRAAGPYVLKGLMSVARDTFSTLHSRDVGMIGVHDLMMSYIVRGALLCLPVMVGAGAVSLASNVLQVGFRVAPKALAPDLSRIDPFKGMARLVSWRSAIELAKAVAKIGVVVYVVYSFLRKEYPALVDLSAMPPAAAGAVVAGLCWRLLARACAAMLVIALIDYLYQRFHFEQTLKMTKPEVKEELKRSEGDPHVKARVKQRQREIARGRMIQNVPTADVVVTNPAHIAVALRYAAVEMVAPVVIAKGQRLVAERIKAVAEAHGIPIIENPPVARLLYKTVEIGQQIPEELYQAVAEILAYVYQLSEKMRGARATGG